MMRIRHVWVLWPAVLALAAGCARAGAATPTTAPGSTAAPEATASAGIDDGRGATALEAYPPALEQAKKWNPEAVLYQVVVTRLMEQNLGLPSDLPGWFYMFRVPGSPVEYYVKVVNGTVNGVTEAQPVIIGEAPYEYLPVDIEALAISSDEAVRLFLENGGKAYLDAHPSMLLDYRLLHIEGQPNPVWSLFDAADLTAPPLFNVDAATGEIVGDPYQ